MGPIQKLVTCTLGIYVCYLAYGIAQEGVYKKTSGGNQFGATSFLLLVQCVTNCLFAVGVMLWEKGNGHKHTSGVTFSMPPMMMSLSYVSAMFCSNEALKYVSYPTQAVAKSCKMIPVMLMGVVVSGKKYSFREYFCVGIITLGIVVFRLAKSKSGGQESSMVGLALLFISLVLDGVTGPIQEGIQERSKTTSPQMMFLCNFWAIVYAGAACIYLGQFDEGIAFAQNNPDWLTSLAIFCVCSALGQNFIFLTIKWFSALTCSTITTTRKFFTVLASVAYYGHQLQQQQWVGTGLVFLGLGIDLQKKYSRNSAAKPASDKKKN
jgi:UDP-galactose transporter B1